MPLDSDFFEKELSWALADFCAFLTLVIAMKMRSANEKDQPAILRLFKEVLEVRATIRYDVFVSGTTKYSDREIRALFKSKQEILDVAVDEDANVIGYVCSKVRAGDKADVAEGFMAIAKQRDMGSGKAAMASFVSKWRAKYPKLRIWAEKAENVLAFYEFPEGLRRLIYTNNRIESFNEQNKRLVKKQIQFVAEEALEKRVVSLFLHYNEGAGRGKVRRWREIVAYYEAK